MQDQLAQGGFYAVVISGAMELLLWMLGTSTATFYSSTSELTLQSFIQRVDRITARAVFIPSALH